MFELDNKLIELLSNKITTLYNELENKFEKDKNEDNYILNFNYYLYKLNAKLKIENKLEEKEIKKIEYVNKLNKLCCNIRDKYIYYK